MKVDQSQFKVIILAAGYGRRMRPLTYQTHKTLLQIGEKTVLQRIIDGILEYHLTDITIVTGYRVAEIKQHLEQNYPHLAINYVHNERYGETNNIYSLSLALQNLCIDKDIILIECDLIFEPAIIEHLLKSSYKNVALVDRYRSGMDGTVVTISKRKIITNVIPPHLQDVDFDFHDKYKTLNIYRFSQEFCNRSFGKILQYYAQTIDDNCYYELIVGLIIYLQKEDIFVEIVDESEKWAEIDDPNDLRIAHFTFNKSKQKAILDSSYGGYWNYNILDYCFIRNMYFPTSSVLSEMKNNLVSLVQNYGSTQTILNQKLATYLYCQEKKVTVLNGVSQVYPIIEQYLAEFRGLLPSPTFGEYSRIFPKAITYSDRVGIDTTEILEKAQNCDFIVFVNPNNPTGSLLETKWIYNFAATHPDKIVILDESFIYFSDQESILPLLENAPLSNVILLVSLSKILGVPGIRLGYVYTDNQAFNGYLHNHIPIWNINSLAEYFLEIILKHQEAIKASFQKTKEDREQFAKELKSLPGVKQVYSSGGNFLLLCLDYDLSLKDNLTQKLLSTHGIYIKDVSSRFNSKKLYLRLAVRNIADNEIFLKAFREVTASLK
ncbi:MAG: aminotransferase class I/II-fold pyridoxal phosphate-dependent enzyme [Nostoc sp.]